MRMLFIQFSILETLIGLGLDSFIQNEMITLEPLKGFVVFFFVSF